MNPNIVLSPKFAVTPAKPKRRTLADIPERICLGWAIRLFGLGSLAWDYADTVLDCAIIMRKPETKKLVRAVRNIKTEYDRFRARSINESYIKRETQIGLDFEEIFQEHLEKLHYGLKNELARYTLEADSAALVEAVQQCLTLIDAMKLFAADCNRQIDEDGTHSILPHHFEALARLIAEFAGDAYDRNSETRRITAKVIYNELKSLAMCDDDGKL